MTETTSYPLNGSLQTNSHGAANGLSPTSDPIEQDPLHGGTKLTNPLAQPSGNSPPQEPPMSPTSTPKRPTRPHRSSTISEMPPFMVSAPGKVIVYGEHAVVYGKGAIAAALSLRSYLLVTPRPKPSRTITLNFADIGLDHSWEIDDLPWTAFTAPGKKKYFFDTLERLDHQLLKAVKPLVDKIKGKVLQNAALSFLYLFLMNGSQHSSGAIYTLRSTIPIGAGLGSSASIAVCLSAALQLQSGSLAMPFKGMTTKEKELQLKRVNNWAFVAEMCIHGNPSGVDNTVATGGKAVLFKRNDYEAPPDVTHLVTFPEMPLLLVNTRQSRRTSEEVKKVRHLLETHEEITTMMLDTIDKITSDAYDIITDPEFSSAPGSEHITRLGELIRINHGLLVSLGVSHPKLERIRELVDHSDIGWTKLTGAGGGGCSITLLKPNAKGAVLEDLEKRLEHEGFEKYETTLGGPGVGVLWPAIVKEEDLDTMVSQDMFLGADGVKGIEKLVGVNETSGAKWNFWR